MATDGSANSEKAADFAIEIAKLFKGNITSLYVIDIGKEYVGDITYNIADEVIDGMRRALKKQGEDAIRGVEEKAKKAGIPIAGKIVEGHPASAIIMEAQESKKDLVIMGRIGITGLNKYLLGSVTDIVIRNSTIPVTIVPPY